MRLRQYLNEAETILFTKDNVQQVKDEITRGINAPYVKSTVSNLGGLPTIMLAISLDPKEKWPNRIFENSRYVRFSIEPDYSKSNMEMFTKSHTIKQKFRKQKAKTVKNTIDKINKYIDSID